MPYREFEIWRQRIWVLYREELIRSGSSELEAEENVQLNISQTMPAGNLLPGNYVFNVMNEGQPVGSVWLNDHESEWFIYDIEIAESERGKGLGRATMKAIESFVRDNSGTAISLSVFGFNKVALRLYETEGYEVTRLAMKKILT